MSPEVVPLAEGNKNVPQTDLPSGCLMEVQ